MMFCNSCCSSQPIFALLRIDRIKGTASCVPLAVNMKCCRRASKRQLPQLLCVPSPPAPGFSWTWVAELPLPLPHNWDLSILTKIGQLPVLRSCSQSCSLKSQIYVMKKYQIETPFSYLKVTIFPPLYSHSDSFFLTKHFILGGTF